MATQPFLLSDEAGRGHLSKRVLTMLYATRCLLVIIAIFSLLVPQSASALSIYDVIMLSQNRYKAENIVDVILITGSAFTLTAPDLVHLKTSGVSDAVAQAMIVAVPPESQGQATNSTDNTDWSKVTLEDLLLLADSEVSEAVILSFIKARERTFTMGASEIVKLYEAGLSDVAIQYLLVSEGIATDDPAGHYESPTVSTDYYPAITMEPYPETVTNRYPPAVPFYPYPRYYYESFIGFGGIHHRLLEHHHVRLHHQREERHVGLHHDNDHNSGLEDNVKNQQREEHHVGLHQKTEHHVGVHDNGEGQHISLHHLTPEHVPKYHSVSNTSTRQTSISKSHRMNNDRVKSVIRQSGHKVKETNGQRVSHNSSQSTGHGLNRQVSQVSGNKLVSNSSHKTYRNSARTSRSPTAPRTTRHNRLKRHER